jgi:1-hydroxycarotenoid 3,4-desaturase
MAAKKISVIGAGVGGLVAGMLLAARGHDVSLFDAAGSVGGKMRTLEVGGRHIDCGPTVLTLLPVFEQIFRDCGQDLGSWVRLERAGLLARHAWSETEHLDLHADRKRSADAIGHFAGIGAARGFLDFCAHAERVYATLNPMFMTAERPSPVGMALSAGVTGMLGLLAAAPFSSLWQQLGTYFPDPRLRQLFGRYATYCGSSPFSAPATLALIAHVEQSGVWLVEGGMQQFARALGRAAECVGARIRTSTEVAEIIVEQGQTRGIRLQSGEVVRSDAVVANCDVGALAIGLLGLGVRPAVPIDAMLPRSLSAATWGFVAEVDGFQLAHHTVFFSRSYEQEFADLFDAGRVPTDPTVYVCAEDRSAEGHAPAGSERLFVIVNAPADAGRSLMRTGEIERCRTAMMQTVARGGTRLKIREEAHAGPADFASRYPGTDGAIYGMASHGWTASFLRPTVRSRIPGLYLAGGSVHPGAGLPMAALSGRAAAQALMEDLRST